MHKSLHGVGADDASTSICPAGAVPSSSSSFSGAGPVTHPHAIRGGHGINARVRRDSGAAKEVARPGCFAGVVSRADVAQHTSTAPSPFAWQSKASAAHSNHRGGDVLRAVAATGPILPDSVGELGATPDARRRSRDVASPSQHPGDSSLVFAMSEDSELKVLASGGTAPTASPPTLGIGAGAPAPLPPTPRNLVNHSRTAHSYAAGSGAVEVDSSDYAAHCSIGQRGAGAGHVLPHTPQVRRESIMDSVPQAGAAVARPSVHVAQQHAGGGGGGATGLTAPTYRSSPHELRTPPALHVCPGAMASHLNDHPQQQQQQQQQQPQQQQPRARGAAVLAAAPPVGSLPPAITGTRWPQRPIPSVSLYPSAAGAGGMASLRGASRATAAAAAAAVTAAAAAAAAATHPSTIAAGGGAAMQHHQRSSSSVGAAYSTDARSQNSGTPPPQQQQQPSQPLEKPFTEAQRRAVLEEVETELYLNYTAIPVPPSMINTGDTDERRRRLDQRRKQIIYGKETEGYVKYNALIPRPCDREFHNPLHAITPRPEYDCSKRQFDRVLNAWRRQLHQWDDCDVEMVEERFLPLGTATLLDLGLCRPPSNRTPTAATVAAAAAATASLVASIKRPQAAPAGVMHSIANVAAMASTGHAHNNNNSDDADAQPHSRSPVFTDNSPTSGLYSSTNLSMHINSGRAASMATACTPSRPQLSEGAEGPQVDESFFLHMNSGNSRVASPFHTAYGGINGRGSAGSHYQHVMMRNSTAHAHAGHAGNGGTPGGGGGGGGYGYFTGLTPAHRPSSRGGMPHHITTILGSEYELMTPSGPGSPAGMPHYTRTGGSPYPLGEPWIPSRRSPTCVVGTAHGVGGHPATAATLGAVTTAKNGGTIVMMGGGSGGGRGESPPHTTELALIPSTSVPSGSGFAKSPYGYRVHSPVQPQAAAAAAMQQQQQQQQPLHATATYAAPLSRQQSRPSVAGAAAAMTGGTPRLQQPGGPAVASVAAANPTHASPAHGMSEPQHSWTPPRAQAPTRASPHALHVHLAATPPSHMHPAA
ncbi:Histone RNA hairpin-binding protein RNA-binding domain containing protein [Novymonas esmeraldas]|uniref:Histone RNA hairpin-binding protein RNA-binding domain containing protein n=1 Tax=Novymonas esmeraldas TaxID=1808958 RepID=A0AAW0ENQ0_9TRYP